MEPIYMSQIVRVAYSFYRRRKTVTCEPTTADRRSIRNLSMAPLVYDRIAALRVFPDNPQTSSTWVSDPHIRTYRSRTWYGGNCQFFPTRFRI